ncbi:hypothetical protein TL16_g00226 [Triparma laevis f. inornata]|uniref:BHLH domain-containing protein n=1 Tax=Triparma laevis f. inornata TaxID=1714386 RepID=A0A9W6Z9E9_9STRA|nr:hypothetical protein TL16_g00226 [Triparma laevis f. inornata]
MSEIDLQGIEPAPISLPRPAVQSTRGCFHHSVQPPAPADSDEDDDDTGNDDEKQRKVVKRMEKKKCREKKRRQDVNDKFNDLTALLDEISPIESTKKTTNRAELITRSIEVIQKLQSDLDIASRHSKRAKLSETSDATQPQATTYSDSSGATKKDDPPACMVYPVPFYNGSYDIPSTAALSGILNVPVTSSGLVEFDEATKPSAVVAQDKPLAKITIRKTTEAEERKKYIVPSVQKNNKEEEPSSSPSIAPCA